jgi:hypothetical protein
MLTVKVLEVGQLDALPHAQNVGCGAEAVEHHPEVAGMQSRHGLVAGLSSMAHAAQSMLDVCPCGNDGAQDHQSEREEGHGRDRASKPKHLSICDQDDCKVFENSVDGNREELEGPCARVDHADEKEGNGEPCCCQPTILSSLLDQFDIHFFASSLLKSR